jgi:uncharacterized membrane protein
MISDQGVAPARTRHPLLALVTALLLTCLAGFAFKAHCLDRGAWTGNVQYRTGCYSDAVPFWTGRGVAAGEIPYLEARLEYPVLTGAAIWAEGRLTTLLFGRRATATGFLLLVSLVNAGLALATLLMLARMGLPRSRLWAWSLAPPLVLYLGHNWDMLAVALAVAALLLAQERRLTEAAATAGLGVAAKLFPVVLLPLIGLGALFGQGSWPARLRAAALATAAAIAAWTAVNLPVALTAFENWSEFYRFSEARGGTAASVWTLLDRHGLLRLSVPEQNSWAGLLFASGAALIVAAGWRRHRARPWLLFAPVLAWFMLTNKVYSPQFDLWLYPVLLVASRRPALIAAFVVTGVFAYFAEFQLFIGFETGSADAEWRNVAATAAARALVMLAIIGSAVVESPPAWLDAARQPGR